MLVIQFLVTSITFVARRIGNNFNSLFVFIVFVHPNLPRLRREHM